MFDLSPMNSFQDVTVGLRFMWLVILGVFQQHLRADLKETTQEGAFGIGKYLDQILVIMK